jgi:mitogen-activated protein kinase kinase 1
MLGESLHESLQVLGFVFTMDVDPPEAKRGPESKHGERRRSRSSSTESKLSRRTRRRPKGLTIDPAAASTETKSSSSKGMGTDVPSFDIHDNCFTKEDVAIHARGVAMKGVQKTFVVDPSELQLGEIIGRGASSYVQQGVHLPTGTPLALKVINICDKGKRSQLIKEIKLLYDAQCPSLISFYGAFYREGAISVALEFMDGGALSNVIAQMGHIPEPPLANITYQLLWALAYLKRKSRVHRDVKPSNVLINSRGFAKLSDFGVASELQNSIAMCATFVGTFKYMSPERIQNEPYSYSSDIWSLALTLAECATGEYPYPEASSYIEMVQTILEAPAPSLDPRRYSPEFCQFISHCVKKSPRDRLPADILLGSPWLVKHGAISYEAAVKNVKAWIDGLAGEA